MGAGVAVAADEEAAGEAEAELRSDDVDDTLIGALVSERRNTEFLAIGFELRDLGLSDLVDDRQREGTRGQAVQDDRPTAADHAESLLERLRGGGGYVPD